MTASARSRLPLGARVIPVVMDLGCVGGDGSYRALESVRKFDEMRPGRRQCCHSRAAAPRFV